MPTLILEGEHKNPGGTPGKTTLKSLQPLQPENGLKRTWGERRQCFFWVNAIDYEFIQAGRKRLSLYVVVCEKSWEAVNDHGQTVTKTARHAWISSRPLTRDNVHERCNLGARYRWGIEAGFLVEKHDVHGRTNAAMAGCQRAAQGYHYEHAFALDWYPSRELHLPSPGHTRNDNASGIRRHEEVVMAGVRNTRAANRERWRSHIEAWRDSGLTDPAGLLCPGGPDRRQPPALAC